MPCPSGLSGRILILGDESKSVRALERLLAASGYAARAIDSFDAAHREVSLNDVALVILEPSASRLIGAAFEPSADDSGESLKKADWAHAALSFCEQVRVTKTPAELPILIISKSLRPQDKIAALHSGVTDYLHRPYQRAEFLSRVGFHVRAWQMERERLERFQQLNILNAVSSVLAASLDPDQLLRDTLAVLIKHMRLDAGIVYLRNDNSQAVSIAAAAGFEASDEVRMGLLELHARTSPLMNGTPLVLEPLPGSARKGLAGEILSDVQAMMCGAIRIKGNPLGAIFLLSKGQSGFAKQSADLLATVCNQISVALENARLYVETKKSAAQLSFVYNLGNNLMTSLEMDELMGYAVFTVGKSLDCDACAVIVKSSAAESTFASAIYARSQSDKQNRQDWYDEARVERYFDNADGGLQPAVEVRVVERFLRDPKISVEMSVPLMFDDQLLGLLICASSAARPINADDQRLLVAVAQQLSLAIRNTELYRRTKDTSINLAVEVSERTREAEEQKRFTEKIIDSLPVSLYVVDRDMRIVAWNRNRELGDSGISRDEVLGKNVFRVLSRQPRRVLEDEFTAVFRTGGITSFEQESWYEGERKVWKISKVPMRVDNAEVSHIITVGEDITEQKKMNEAVIHAEKLASIGRLAAGVVHEINNPLATIAACAEALTARVEDITESAVHDDFSEYLQIIRDEAFRCKAITNSLLEFSHQRQAEKNIADVNQIIEQTLLLVKHHPKLGKMQVVRELDQSLTPVLVNEGQMKQVYIALISNAFDAMDGDGTLTIRTHWSEDEPTATVAVEFSDTGSGIPAAHLQKIFDPFFTTKPLGRGTGLGLSVCYGIVSEHGGRIEVNSTEGQGTTFRVLLPIHQYADGDRSRQGAQDEMLVMEAML
ncbi:MAG: ATP-binding protein [Blastocatellia bacterium]